MCPKAKCCILNYLVAFIQNPGHVLLYATSTLVTFSAAFMRAGVAIASVMAFAGLQQIKRSM